MLVFDYTTLTPAIQGNIRRKFNHFRAGDTTYDYKIALDKIIKQKHCYLTGREIDLSQPNTWSLDHRIPLAKGGGSSIDNMMLACREANYAKGDMHLEDFYQLCKEIYFNLRETYEITDDADQQCT